MPCRLVSLVRFFVRHVTSSRILDPDCRLRPLLLHLLVLHEYSFLLLVGLLVEITLVFGKVLLLCRGGWLEAICHHLE